MHLAERCRPPCYRRSRLVNVGGTVARGWRPLRTPYILASRGVLTNTLKQLCCMRKEIWQTQNGDYTRPEEFRQHSTLSIFHSLLIRQLSASAFLFEDERSRYTFEYFYPVIAFSAKLDIIVTSPVDPKPRYVRRAQQLE